MASLRRHIMLLMHNSKQQQQAYGEDAMMTNAEDWEMQQQMLETEREFESACLSALVEQLSRADRNMVREVIRKKKIKVKVPGGVYCCRGIEGMARVFGECRSVKVQIGWSVEKSEGQQSPENLEGRLRECEDELCRVLPELVVIGNGDTKIELSIKATKTEILNAIIELISSWKINQMMQKINFKKLVIKGSNKNRPTLDRFPTLISIPVVEFHKLAIDFYRYPSFSYGNNIQSSLFLIKCKLTNFRQPLPRNEKTPNLTLINVEFQKVKHQHSGFHVSYQFPDTWTQHLQLELSKASSMSQLFAKFDFQRLQDLTLDHMDIPLDELFRSLPKRLPLLKLNLRKRRLYLSHLLKSIPARKLPMIQLKLMSLLNFRDEKHLFVENPQLFGNGWGFKIQNYSGEVVEYDRVQMSEQAEDRHRRKRYVIRQIVPQNMRTFRPQNSWMIDIRTTAKPCDILNANLYQGFL